MVIIYSTGYSSCTKIWAIIESLIKLARYNAHGEILNIPNFWLEKQRPFVRY